MANILENGNENAHKDNSAVGSSTLLQSRDHSVSLVAPIGRCRAPKPEP